jgi:two-component system, NtrC family, response regulator AtoC
VNSGMDRRTILVGEDDAEVRDYLGVTLRCRGYNVQLAVDGEGVINHLQAARPVSLVLLDIMMPNKDGWETLRDIRNMNLDVPVIMLSGMSSPPNIVQAIKGGAVDFLAKPINHKDLGEAIERALSLRGEPRDEDDVDFGREMFFGKNVAMNGLRSLIPKVAASDVPVLIQGETGTGKEVLARQVHGLSARSNKPFVKLNCAAVPAELIESELFGYERGAFTGAFQKKPGLFEMADGGTILLDEIGDMDVRLQAKLLQVLQDQEFRRVGGTEVVRVDVRVIAATHRDLVQAIKDRTFREDLYFRLNIVSLALPALRERKEDILSLAQFFISRHGTSDSQAVVLTPALEAALVAFRWPGNVRQLENVMRKMIVLRDPDVIVRELGTIDGKGINGDAADASDMLVSDRKKLNFEPSSVLQQASRAKQEAEAEAILQALHSSRWNRKQAAAMLQIEYKTLLYKMKKLEIEERASKISLTA